MTRSLPATIALPPSEASSLATRMNLLVSLAVCGVAQHEAFLVVADGGADHLLGDRQERRVERTHQRHRPFHQAGDFGEQAVVLHQLVALREGQILGVGEDHVGAPRRIEHHLGRLELGDVVVEAPHLERAGAMKRWPRVSSEAAMPSTLNATTSGSSVSGPKVARIECSGRTQVSLAAAPTHRLRPGKAAHHFGDHLRHHVDRRAARLLDHRHVEVALLVGLHFGLVDRGQAGRLEEAGDGLRRRADARALLLFLDVGLAHRHAVHRQRQPARRGEGLGAFVDEPGRPPAGR